METIKIFIVEDNLFYANILKVKIEEIIDSNVQLYSKSEDLLRDIHEMPDIIFLDHNLPDGKGLHTMKEIKATYPHIQCVMVSGQATIGVAIESLKFGATDYLIKGKDDNNESLKRVLNACIQLSKIKTRKRKKRLGLPLNLF